MRGSMTARLTCRPLAGLYVGVPCTVAGAVRRGSVGQTCTSNAASQEPGRDEAPTSWWTRFVAWSYKRFGQYAYPVKADICNCGIDLAIKIPRPELVLREGIERGSMEWRMQLFGAALYWFIARISNEKICDANDNMLRGKDVLEVACMRGGGAAYLMEVAGPRTYVATDNVEEHVEGCRKLHRPREGLRFDLAEASSLHRCFAAETFDFVICIQAATKFADIQGFIKAAHYVLRPGGRLILVDAFARDKYNAIQLDLQNVGFVQTGVHDLSRAVHAAGLCSVPPGLAYFHIIAQKEMHSSEAVVDSPSVS